MAERRDLDETDMHILRLLTENSRRSFRDIAEAVSLSAPAVSDRIERLQDQGIINRFTVEIDRSIVHGTTPVFIDITPIPSAVDAVYQSLSAIAGIEQTFKTVDGRIIAHAHAPGNDIESWLWEPLDETAISSLSVDLLSDVSWYSALDQATFSLDCVVCDNRVGTEGITATFAGEPKSFCCPSCLRLYEDRYEEHISNVE